MLNWNLSVPICSPHKNYNIDTTQINNCQVSELNMKTKIIISGKRDRRVGPVRFLSTGTLAELVLCLSEAKFYIFRRSCYGADGAKWLDGFMEKGGTLLII